MKKNFFMMLTLMFFSCIIALSKNSNINTDNSNIENNSLDQIESILETDKQSETARAENNMIFSSDSANIINDGLRATSDQKPLEVYGNVFIPSNYSYWIGAKGDSGNRLRLHHAASTGCAYIDYAQHLYFRAETSTVVSFLGNGNVGIGTQNPSQKLEVNGVIRAKEVIIESSNWPDYVFSPDYQLNSLETVSNHIKEHRHLPDFPSEKEIKESGINLGDIQVKLLQKIEELTLYAIQQQEMIDKLNSRIEQLENK